MTMEPLFTIFGLPVTAYAACVTAGAALSAWLLMGTLKRASIKETARELFLLLSLLLGAFFSHLLYCLVQLPDILAEYGAAFLLNPARGGFMVYGAMLGVALAALITAKVTKVHMGALLDASVAAGALMLAVCRFAEYFDGQGFGIQVDETPALCFFPLSFSNEYGEWYLAIFLFEGLFALLAGQAVSQSKTRRTDGGKAVLFLILYAAGQTLFETLRRDQVIKWGFIRVSQLISVLILAAILLCGQLMMRKKGGEKRRVVLPWAAFILLTGACVGLEFTVDKPIPIGDQLIYLPYVVTYLLIGLFAAGMGLLAYRSVNPRSPKKG